MRMRALGTSKGLFPVNLPTRLFRLACVVLTVGLAGCASISQLTVAPTTVCPGENVNVSWRTCGTTTLTQVPIRPGQSDECVDSLPVGASPVPVSNSGTVERQASGDTVFYVEAKGWLGKPAHKCVRVFVNEGRLQASRNAPDLGQFAWWSHGRPAPAGADARRLASCRT